jgi:SAM-dependent methyltransferase
LTTETVTTNSTGLKILTRDARKLDVGAGAKSDDGWETIDISPAYHPDFQHDITSFPWPFDDDTFDELRCWHVLEHMAPITTLIDFDQRKVEYINTRIAVMNEMHRILKPGAAVNIEVPVFPYWQAMADPTHVSFFVPQTFWYFTKEEHAEHRALYGIKRWKILGGKKNTLGSILSITLAKVVE